VDDFQEYCEGREGMTREFSHEAETCEECQKQGFTIRHGLIRNPGKFEGESLSTYHAWHYVLEGMEDDTVYDGNHPISRVGNVIVDENEAGFVCGVAYDKMEQAMDKMDEIAKEVG
jgi:hypothetical protein